MLELFPLLAPIALLAAATLAFRDRSARPIRSARQAEQLAAAAVVLTLPSACLAVSHGGAGSGLIGFAGWGFSTRVDALSMTMLLLVTFVGWVVVRFSATYLDGETGQGRFTGWLCCALAAVMMLVIAGNLLQLLLAWTAIGLCLHRLLLFRTERAAARRAARKKAIMAIIGGLCMLAAVTVLGNVFGTGDIATILAIARDGEAPAGAAWAAVLLSIAALLKSAQFPTQGWLTEVMEAPTPVSALLHAGIVNAGGFLLIRFADLLLLAPLLLAMLVMIGGLTAIVAALVMLTQSVVKTSLAWSTVSQMGFMVMQCGLALFPLALLHIVAHSLYKAHAFLCAGETVERLEAARRPGPVAVPAAGAVGIAFVTAALIYVAVGLLFGFEARSPQAIALGAILIFGVAYLIAQGMAGEAPRALGQRTLLYSIAAAIAYFALHGAAKALFDGTLPPAPVPGPLEWALLTLAVVSFGIVAIAQSLFPLWAHHPAAAGLRVHLTNGLYANAIVDRLLGGWSNRRQAPVTAGIGRPVAPSHRRPGAHQRFPDMDTITPMNPGRAAIADRPATLAAARRSAEAIPPLWPLAATVAVNPFLGQSHEGLAAAGARLGRVAGAPITMRRSWYADRIDAGQIDDDDLGQALQRHPVPMPGGSVAELKALAATPCADLHALPTVAELAAEATGIDWPGLIAERFGVWAGAHFDAGQALWSAPTRRGPYAEWRSFATHDLTPEIVGLPGFAAHVVDAPDHHHALLQRAITRLGLPEAALETYFHRLLTTLGGWAQYGRWHAWQAELAGGSDDTTVQLLAIRLTWEEALFERHAERIAERWQRVRDEHATDLVPAHDLHVDAVLQEAAEIAAQRDLANRLAQPASPSSPARPHVQAVFCIDVRSEVFRRALEGSDPGIRTLGFAGFFGMGLSHRRFASDVAEHRMPVLLTPALTTHAGGEQHREADTAARLAARAQRAWGRFKLAAVSSFAFVEAMGPVYVVKLLRDALGLRSATPMGAEPAPRLDLLPALPARLSAAQSVLKAMSLTRDFARIVLLCGHGAKVSNNPHSSALQCGACGGYSGETNARLLAALLNDASVRDGLRGRGIDLPDDTLFIAALHDTTTDTVRVFDGDVVGPYHGADLSRLRERLVAAGRIARAERALRLPRADGEHAVRQRARDWAEIRPEWSLAGCSAFVAAPRSATLGKAFDGRAFLHDYDACTDEGFAILELIITAPVVVASWISLQYYGSCVAPTLFGAGDKLLHNVVGGIGVVEGNGGELRSGLPWQSVHDGESLAHEPLRLSVCIAAPRDAMSAILERHPEVRALFDNRWLHLFALDDQARMSWRYTGDLDWEPIAWGYS